MEINLNFVFFEELPEPLEQDGVVAKISIVRGSKDFDVSIEDGGLRLDSIE